MPNTQSIGVAYSDQAIVGGTVDNSVIGGTTPAAVSATTVSASGAASFLTGTAPAAAAAAPVGVKFSSTANLGVFFGTGTPAGTVSAAKGSLYINTAGASTTTRLYINTDGATSWTYFTTAA